MRMPVVIHLRGTCFSVIRGPISRLVGTGGRIIATDAGRGVRRKDVVLRGRCDKQALAFADFGAIWLLELPLSKQGVTQIVLGHISMLD